MVKKIKTTTIRSGWGRGRGFVSLPLRPLQRLDSPSWPWPSTRRFTSSRGRRAVPSRRCVFYRCCNHGPRPASTSRRSNVVPSRCTSVVGCLYFIIHGFTSGRFHCCGAPFPSLPWASDYLGVCKTPSVIQTNQVISIYFS